MISISEINIYPIKSLAGVSKSISQIEPQGLAQDRCFMLVDKNNQFITQRKHPTLALVSVIENEGAFLVNAPNKKELTIKKNLGSGTRKNVTIWNDTCQAITYDKMINQWFSDFLGIEVYLVGYDFKKPRQTDPLFSKAEDIVSFADGFPILVISQASLDDLNSKLVNPVTMQRFRPNIVVNGCEAFDEDHWRNITIGSVEFEAVKICSRCILTTIDPNTGLKNENGEPLKTLSSYRKNISGVKNEKGVFFGMNLIPRTKGVIKLHDNVLVKS